MIDYSSVLNNTVRDIKPSGIRKFFDLLETKKDVIGLTVGQPDFVTPWHIRAAAIDSIEKGKTYYTSNKGTKDLRVAISAYLNRRFGLSYDPEKEISVTVGGSEAIDMAMRALINPGDEVIIPQPAYVCYGPICSLCGGVPVYIDTKEENEFKLMPEELKAAITPKTKLLILPYPNNPTGSIMTRQDLEKIADVLRDTNIMILSDEIYAELTYEGHHTSIASIDGMWERTVLASGFSKAYAMTGWRMGYVCAPAEISSQMLKIHQYAIMCAPTASQFGATEAMNFGDQDIEYMKSEYDKRRRFLTSGLKALGLDCFTPKGAFYSYPNISVFGMKSDDLCQKLLEEYSLALVPGNAFCSNGDDFVRISYAYSINHISKALDLLEKFAKDMKK